MPEWLVWFLVAGNLLNMVFDGTIVVCKATAWLKKRAVARDAENEGRGRYPAGWP